MGIFYLTHPSFSPLILVGRLEEMGKARVGGPCKHSNRFSRMSCRGYLLDERQQLAVFDSLAEKVGVNEVGCAYLVVCLEC